MIWPISFFLIFFNTVFAQEIVPTYGEFFHFDEKDISEYQPQIPPFISVTTKHGPLFVKIGKYEYEANHKVWSSHWFPYYEKELFETEDSPLAKYDTYARKRGYQSKAREYEKNKVYNERASDWEGLCNAWAMAAIMFPEPKKAVKLYNIHFEVRDLKALLLKSLELETGDQFFGQRNNAEWDSLYADVYPDQFHRFIQVEGFEKKNPFVMDYDAGYQVWNVPVYKVKSIIKEVEGNSEVLDVKTYVYYASPFIFEDNFVGIETEMKIYEYDLHGQWEGDHFRVNYGLWKDSSKWDHPDYLIPRPKRSPKRVSRNKEIKPNIIDEILRYSY
ncbi:MAG: hypothetical protein ACO20H_08280 [Bacteriovoracaceae bacterium]